MSRATAAAAPAGDYAACIAGETMLLSAHKAMYWPRRKMLIVADIHFGKAASFRALGVPVPRGTTTENLAVLDTLLASHDTEEIVFLGDFLHAKAGHALATLAAMLAWRARHPALRLTLVRGNHDLHAGDPAAGLGMRVVDEPYLLTPFALCHHADTPAPAYVLAGHVHPVFLLGAGRDMLRLPCFVLGETRALLPSFGAFTGGYPVRPQAGDGIYVSSGEAVLRVPV